MCILCLLESWPPSQSLQRRKSLPWYDSLYVFLFCLLGKRSWLSLFIQILAVDTSHQEVYCNLCEDYIYDKALDEIVATEARNARERNQMLLGIFLLKFVISLEKNKYKSPFLAEPTHTAYHPWEASKDESVNLERNSKKSNIPKHIIGMSFFFYFFLFFCIYPYANNLSLSF